MFFELEALGDKLFEKEAKIHQRCRDDLRTKSAAARRTQKQMSEIKIHTNKDNIIELDTTKLPQNRRIKEAVNKERLFNYIDNEVIATGLVISISNATASYYGDEDDTINTSLERYRRGFIKETLKKHYGDNIYIVPISGKEPEVIFGASAITKTIKSSNDEHVVKLCALKLRDAVLEYEKKMTLSWPPNHEQLIEEENKIPSLISIFFEALLKNPKHSLTSSNIIKSKSMVSDAIHNITEGRVLTAKHVSLGQGIHSITGQKVLVQVVNKLGHCITYDKVMDAETTQAQIAAEAITSNDQRALPLKPVNDTAKVRTAFWADNLDKNTDNRTGASSVHMTTLMAFQEVGLESIKNSENVEKSKSKTRQVQFEYPIENINVNKIEPPILPFMPSNSDEDEANEDTFQVRYFAWLLLRLSSKGQRQIHPSLSGFLLRLRKQSQWVRPTKYEETFLPPIPMQVTDASTIIAYLKFLERQAEQMNLQYCNITLDVGAAINAFLVKWQREEGRGIQKHHHLPG